MSRVRGTVCGCRGRILAFLFRAGVSVRRRLIFAFEAGVSVRGRLTFASLLLAASMAPIAASADDPAILLRPTRVFDGATMHEGWQVLIRGDRIIEVGANLQAPSDARQLDLSGDTLIPGLIEGHG